MSNLKQGTLSFSSTKQRSSARTAKSRQSKSGAEQGQIKLEVKNGAQTCEEHEISFNELEITVPAKRTRASTKTSSSRTTKQPLSHPSESEKEKPSSAAIEREHLDVEDKASRYCKYYNEVRSKMGYISPIHAEGQNRIHQMLRFFDMSYEFGPCIGMTRLERWERAEAFGLDPPVEVRDILLTKEGIEKTQYAQSVLENEV